MKSSNFLLGISWAIVLILDIKAVASGRPLTPLSTYIPTALLSIHYFAKALTDNND